MKSDNETTALCRKPDGRGIINPRCQHVIDASKYENKPRQCLRAAKRETDFCETHQEQGA